MTDDFVTVLLQEAQASGIELRLVDGQLKFSCYLPPSDPVVMAILRNAKEIAERLKAESCAETPDSTVRFRERESGSLGPYRDALVALQASCPVGIGDSSWRMAIADAEAFIRRWWRQAAAFGWSRNDLFAVPKSDFSHRSDFFYPPGLEGGLCWRLRGDTVRELWTRHAVLSTGDVVVRLFADEWARSHAVYIKRARGVAAVKTQRAGRSPSHPRVDVPF
jgi:hypothetical protein